MKRVISFFLSAIFILSTSLYPVIAAPQSDPPEKIVFLSDLSGSVKQFDKDSSLKDAFSLGVRLAPDGSQVAVMGVTSEVVVETPLLDTSDQEKRNELIAIIDQFSYVGNTNLILALQKAVEKLGGGGRIILFADISEGGLTSSSKETLNASIEQARFSAEECRKSGIVVDMMLVGRPPEDSELAAAIEQIASESGGRILRPDTATELSASVEKLLFSAYPYFIQTLTIMNSSTQMQSLPVLMPSNHLHRARIYVPSAVGIQASYAGAGLETQKSKTYSLLDLSRPARDGLTLSVAPSDRETTIYLISDYRLTDQVQVASEVIVPRGKEEAYRQTVTVTLDVLDEESGQSILSSTTAALFSAMLTLTAPDGSTQTLQAKTATDGRYQVHFEPAYGNYQLHTVLTSGEYSFPAFISTFEVEDIRPVEEPKSFAIPIAITISALLLLFATLFAIHQRKQASYQGAVEMASNYRFYGKLSIYAVMLEGGNREIRPFDFRLHTLPDKRITLRNILDSIGEKDIYEGAENILFLVGPEESIVVRNNSQASMRVMGRNYDYRSSTQLFYDQKCYIIFEKDVSELEIKYCRVKAGDSAPMQFNIQSRRGHS